MMTNRLLFFIPLLMLFQNCHQKQTKTEVIKTPFTKLSCDTSFQLISVYHDSVAMCIPKYFFLNKEYHKYAYYDTEGKDELIWFQGKFPDSRVIFWKRRNTFENEEKFIEMCLTALDVKNPQLELKEVKVIELYKHKIVIAKYLDGKSKKFIITGILKEHKSLFAVNVDFDAMDSTANKLDINTIIKSLQLNY